MLRDMIKGAQLGRTWGNVLNIMLKIHSRLHVSYVRVAFSVNFSWYIKSVQLDRLSGSMYALLSQIIRSLLVTT